MPITALLMAIAALSMAGVWPLNGFVSKELIFEALLAPPFGPNVWTWSFVVLAVAGSVFTTAYSLILAHRILFGRVVPARHVTGYKVDEGLDEDHFDANEFVERAHDPPAPMLLGPALLVGLVVVLGIYPFPLESSLYQAVAAASLGSVPHHSLHTLPVIGWPLLMSLVALGAGALLYVNLERVAQFLEATPRRWSANVLYEAALRTLHRVAESVDRTQMTGFLRDYVLFTVGAVVLLMGYSIVRGLLGGLRLDLAPVTLWEVVALGLVAVGAIMAVVLHRRIPALIALGSVGAMVSLLFVFWNAPDLALTQLMVEAISTVLIVVVFSRLPQISRESASGRYRAANIAVAVGFGLMASLVSAIALGNVYFESISHYFVENSIPLGGGANIVNVILVDFRGFDTMGEITVLSIAALSIRALLRARVKSQRGKTS